MAIFPALQKLTHMCFLPLKFSYYPSRPVPSRRQKPLPVGPCSANWRELCKQFDTGRALTFLHFCIFALLQFCIFAFLHFCIFAFLHFCIFAFLHVMHLYFCFIVAIIHFCIVAYFLHFCPFANTMN